MWPKQSQPFKRERNTTRMGRGVTLGTLLSKRKITLWLSFNGDEGRGALRHSAWFGAISLTIHARTSASSRQAS